MGDVEDTLSLFGVLLLFFLAAVVSLAGLLSPRVRGGRKATAIGLSDASDTTFAHQGFSIMATKKDERQALLERGNREVEMSSMGGAMAPPRDVTSL